MKLPSTIAALLACSMAACSTSLSSRDNENLSIASNPSQDYSMRIAASRELSAPAKKRLRLSLESQLPGMWDLHTLHAVALLAEVGNAETLQLFDRLSTHPGRPGKIAVAMIGASRNIRQHLGWDTSKPTREEIMIGIH